MKVDSDVTGCSAPGVICLFCELQCCSVLRMRRNRGQIEIVRKLKFKSIQHHHSSDAHLT